MFGYDPLPRSLEAALRDLRDAKPLVRASAVRDLGKLAAEPGADRAREALVDALTEDAFATVRSAAAVALADAGVRSEAATLALLAALDDSHLEARQMALLALGEIGDGEDPRVRAAVESARGDDSAALRFQAIIASHGLGLPSVEDALLAAASDTDPAVRHIALRLLEERASASPSGPSVVVVDAARTALDDTSRSVRLCAAILLARAGHEDGHPVIASVVAGGSGVEPEDEQEAVVLAGELRLEAARKGLRSRAFKPLLGQGRFAYEATVALARMGDERARASIVKGLSSWTRDTRTLSVVAAGRASLSEARATLEAMRGDASRAEPEAVEEALAALSSGAAGGLPRPHPA